MKRDKEVALRLLKVIEADDRFNGSRGELVGLADLLDDNNRVQYQLVLLATAGFIDVDGFTDSGMPLVKGLTWAGHDYIDSASAN